MKSLKILLDECIDWRLARYITGHTVTSSQRAGLAGLKNGELLTKAQVEFDIFITVDRNLTSQQNLTKFRIGIIVLRTKSNRIADLKELAPLITNALPDVQPSQVMIVGG